MSGMKNYLVKHGEREFEKEVEKERLKLRPNEFLNLDAILEDVMMGLVVRPLREHVCRLFIDYYVATGVLQTLAENIQHAQGKTIHDLGVRVRRSHIQGVTEKVESIAMVNSRHKNKRKSSYKHMSDMILFSSYSFFYFSTELR